MSPLLPAGFTVFETLPVGALVLDALAPAIGNGLITMSENGAEGVLVVRNGVIAERVWVTGGVRSRGDEAAALIRAADAAMVSARRLEEDAMGLLGALLHGNPYYTDLRLEWVAWPQFLGDLCTRGETFVVELQTPAGRGVAFLRDGRQLAAFTETHLALGDASLLNDLAAGGVGTIRVFVDDSDERAPGDRPRAVTAVAPQAVTDPAPSDAISLGAVAQVRDPLHTQTASPEIAPVALAPPRAELAERFVLSDAGSPLVLPLASQAPVDNTAHPNATFTAMFGPHDETPGDQPLGALSNASHAAGREVASMLPQLKLLVQHRLQRSAASVEEIVEGAATDHQSVGWLSDRVRVVTMRGFLHSTFDQLADDMLALADREPD